MITVTRYHDFSAGHRVCGHENKCANLHGHNYRVHFTCTQNISVTNAETDNLGRVVDFSVIKDKLCNWLEENWDHNFLIWKDDVEMKHLVDEALNTGIGGFVIVPFNPTAENMALHLMHEVARCVLAGTNVYVTKIVIEETRKCSAEYSI